MLKFAININILKLYLTTLKIALGISFKGVYYAPFFNLAYL